MVFGFTKKSSSISLISAIKKIKFIVFGTWVILANEAHRDSLNLYQSKKVLKQPLEKLAMLQNIYSIFNILKYALSYL